MDIFFKTNKFAKECNDLKKLVQRYGAENAKRIRSRFDDLSAAPNLEAMRTLPGRCHELTGNMAGLLAIDAKHPYRLIFEPAHDPIPCKVDGGLDWSEVTAICVLRIEDYHG